MSEQMPEKPKTPPPNMPNRFSRSMLGWVVIIGLALVLGVFLKEGIEGERREISATEFWNYARDGRIEGIILVREREIEGTLAADTPGLNKDDPRKFRVKYDYRAQTNFNEQLQKALAQSQRQPQPKVKYEFTGFWENTLPQFGTLIVAMLLLWFFVFRRLGAGAGGSGFLTGFGRSRHRVMTKEHTKITFNDVAGIDEAKEEVREIIEFLRNPRKFQRLGGRVPRGVLLVGEPGCGKTMLAKAIAGEADVPFFSISGSDFVEMFVGVGASRVRDLFKQAKDSAPCIIFLDEIDAVGRRRGMGFNGGGHDEREQTLNAILVEIDGFDSSDQVIVIAATNRSDILDPALTRPGRFDRQITVPLPDLNGRAQILKIYADKVRCGPDVDISRLARGTPMFSGADLAALVNEAAIAATMSNKEYIEMSDMEEARDKVRWGRARKSRVDETEKEVTAYHEAGHALVQMLTPGADPLHKVSIIPRGSYGGATFSLPEKDRYLYTRNFCKAQVRVLLGGRMAEKLFCNDISSGAASDITVATDLARKMVLDWGMSDKLGFVRYSADERKMLISEMGTKDYSEKTAEVIDQEVRAIIDEADRDTQAILEANRDKMKALAVALIRYETLSGEEARQIISGQTFDKPSMSDLFEREQARSASPASPVPAVPADPGTVSPAAPESTPPPGGA